MTVRGKHGKPRTGFPPFPPPLEIAFAIPTFQQFRRARKSGKPKAGFPLYLCSTLSLPNSKASRSKSPSTGTTTTRSVTFLPEAIRQPKVLDADQVGCDARTVLASKGSLSRAEIRRALARCAPFRPLPSMRRAAPTGSRGRLGDFSARWPRRY